MLADAWKEWEEKLKLLSPTGQPPPKPKMLVKKKDLSQKKKVARESPVPAEGLQTDNGGQPNGYDDSWNALSKALEQRIAMAKQHHHQEQLQEA